MPSSFLFLSPGLRRAAAAGALVLAALAWSGAPASAANPAVIVKVHQSSGALSTYFQLNGRPGGTVHAGTLELVNPTSQQVSVSLDPVDSLTTDTLGSAYRLKGTAIHGAAQWLQLDRRRVTIGAHGSASVALTVLVPSSAGAGDYLGGVAVEALGQHAQARPSRNLAVGEVDRYGVGVEVSLPGVRHPKIVFTGAAVARDPASVVFRLAAGNTGNVILKGVHGWAQVTKGGHIVAATQIEPGTFVTGTAINYPVFAPREQPAPGTVYRVRAELIYAGGIAYLDTLVTFGHAAAVTQQQFGGPRVDDHGIPTWVWIAIGVAALACLLVLWFLLMRRRRRRVAGARALRRLERAAADARREDLPLSLVRIETRGQSRAERRRTTRVLYRVLRRSDFVCDFGDEGLAVALPGTGRRMAGALAAEIEELLGRAQGPLGGARVAASTMHEEIDFSWLLKPAGDFSADRHG